MGKRLLLIYALISVTVFIHPLYSAEIPSGREIKGEVIEKGKGIVTIRIDYPQFCKGIRTFSVAEGTPIPSKGLKIKASFEKKGTCDEESPVINKIEVVRDEEN